MYDTFSYKVIYQKILEKNGVSILKIKDCSSALLYVQAQDQDNNPIILFSYLNENILYMLSTLQ